MHTHTPDENNIQTVERDGGSADITADELSKFKDEVRQSVADTLGSINTRRSSSENIRLCVWPGQSEDGRLRKSALGKKPWNFEGALDGRLRTADGIVNEKKIVICLAAMRALSALRVTSMQTHDPARGSRLTTLLRWVIKNKIGRKTLRRVLEQWAEYCLADAPAVGMLGVWWERESFLEEKVMSLDEIATLMLQHFKLPLPAVKAVLGMIADPSQEDAAAEFIMELLADVPVGKARARNIVWQLRTAGACVFPNPYWRINGPCWYAYRLFEDIFCPSNTPADAQRARWWLIRESLSESELHERINSKGYTEDFVKEVLEKGSDRSILNFQPRQSVSGDGSQSTQWASDEPNPYKGTYEVLTIYFRATNDAHVPGVYYFPFNFDCESAGHERKLLDYNLNARSVYPFISSSRETLNNCLLDSRGIPELAMTDQDQEKLFDDCLGNNVLLKVHPPWEIERQGIPGLGGRPGFQPDMRPFGSNYVDRRGRMGPMDTADYPVGISEHKAHLRRRSAEYFGRFSADEGVHPMLAQLFNQWSADKFGDDVMEACSLTLSLCQQFMTDEEVARVCDLKPGPDGTQMAVPIARDRESIQGEFGLEFEYDVRNMDVEFVQAMAEVIGQIMMLDTENVTIRGFLVQWLMSALNPNLAEQAVRPVEAANASEQKDERNNIAQIASAGLEPDMAEQGQNFGTRLQVWMEWIQKNPQAMDDWPPLKRQIAEARMKHLHDQHEQFTVNPGIGRSLGKKVTE